MVNVILVIFGPAAMERIMQVPLSNSILYEGSQKYQNILNKILMKNARFRKI
jgi:hypothetical protein